jgi:hypothetical protein
MDDDPVEERRRVNAQRVQRRVLLLGIGVFVGLAACMVVVAAIVKNRHREVVQNPVIQPPPQNHVIQPPQVREPSTPPIFAGPVIISADELAQSTIKNPAAVLQYKSRTFRVTGKMERVTATIYGQCYLTMVVQKGESPRFGFDNPADVAHLKAGDVITVEGNAATTGSSVDIGSCRLIR